jgi:hypothetical protein
MISVKRWEKLRAGHSSKDRDKVLFFFIQPDAGNGDLLYNTCREIIDKDMHDEWAHNALEEVFKCLEKGVRWPDYMIPYITVATGMGDRQFDMTQDPWLLAYACAIHLDRRDLIEKYKPEKGIFNFTDKWAYRNALLGKRNLYGLWRVITPHIIFQKFVYVFYGYMDQAYKKRGA